MSVNNESMNNAARIASNYFEKGAEYFDQIVIGEESAKDMVLMLGLTGAANGMAGALWGPPGGSKSALIENAHRPIGGIGEEQIAVVPHHDELSPAQLVGDTSEMERTTTKNNETETETISGTVKPILRPGILKVQFDEIPRTSPLALNAALKITQDGGIEVGNGTRHIEGFDLVLAAGNNYGGLYQHQLDPALVNRLAAGALMGVRNPGETSAVADAIWDTPRKLTTQSKEIDEQLVTPREELLIARAAVDEVVIPEPMRDLGKRYMLNMVDALGDNGISMADGRVGLQLRRMARALSLLRANQEVTESALRQAVTMGMTARLGASTKQSPAQIDDVIKQVTD